MRVDTLLEMIGSQHADRVAYTAGQHQLTYGELQQQAARGGLYARSHHHSAIVNLTESSTQTPVTLFAASFAGIPYIPLNYRLSGDAIGHLLNKHPGALIIANEDVAKGAISAHAWTEIVGSGTLADGRPADETFATEEATDENSIAALIYTSGTTAEPKAAIVRHAHLVNYVLGNVEFGDATHEEAALVCLPPYHIAGLMSLLSNLYLGRRVVFLPTFDCATWSETIETQAITHATVVPTMLARLLAWAVLQPNRPAFTSLKTLASGGAPLPVAVARRVMEFWPHVGLVNAYGLTETSSTISVMDPESYRAALISDDHHERARIGSVGRPIVGIEVQIRRPDGSIAGAGEHGEIFVRGDQVSGEYLNRAPNNDPWFACRDLGYVDAEGYLFVLGRSDDTIIRGGENIAPATIEEILLGAPGVAEAVVVGLPDDEWGQKIEAVVVSDGTDLDAEQLRRWCLKRLRSALTPQRISIWRELPTNDAGKVVRREIVRRLLAVSSPTPNDHPVPTAS